jgi:DUF4097 and DUF4098 domain-containing protein YvlB
MTTRSCSNAFLAAGFLLACAPALASTPIDQTRTLDPRGRVEVENLKGSIEVRAWDRAEVRIEGSLGEGVERLEVEGDGKRLRIKVKYPARSGLRSLAGRETTGPTELRLMVPLRADLALSAVSADITAWGVAPSSLRIENVSGNSTLAGAPDDVEVNTVSGDVDLTVNRGNVRAESVSGDIRISGRLGEEVVVESVSGDIDMRVLDSAVRRLEGQSVSGDMTLQMALAPRARLRLQSVSGDVELRLPQSTSAEVRAESFSGTLRAPGATVERPRHGPGSSLRHRYGSGDADVSIETFSGDAHLRFD